MRNPINECIAAKCFASLILDYEYKGDDYMPPCVSCRVLIEDLYQTRIHAETREKAIEMFLSGVWKEASHNV